MIRRPPAGVPETPRHRRNPDPPVEMPKKRRSKRERDLEATAILGSGRSSILRNLPPPCYLYPDCCDVCIRLHRDFLEMLVPEELCPSTPLTL